MAHIHGVVFSAGGFALQRIHSIGAGIFVFRNKGFIDLGRKCPFADFIVRRLGSTAGKKAVRDCIQIFLRRLFRCGFLGVIDNPIHKRLVILAGGQFIG